MSVTIRVLLTQRDKEILCYLFEQKVAFTQQIYEKFFEGKHRTTCTARLEKLRKYRLISKAGCQREARLVAYFSLKEQGLKYIRQNYSFDSTNIRFKSDSLEHDLELSAIRNWLEKTQMVKRYYSENVLQNCDLAEKEETLYPLRAIRADAALKIRGRSGEFIVAFEYERKIKNSSRYGQKLSEYYLDSSIQAVLYLCENDTIERSIRKIDQEISDGFVPKVFTLSKSKWQEDQNVMPFRNGKNDILTIL